MPTAQVRQNGVNSKTESDKMTHIKINGQK